MPLCARSGQAALHAAHTCASLLFESGKNIRQVSDWLGHADPAFTLRTYVHLMDSGLGDAGFFDTLLHPTEDNE